ncbi:oxidoreductase [Pseudomonas sp. UL073]|uniref:Oxidoreductase n=1 Tax=Zestomonas insulae TaxID=2809017 RepID=A0ABS2ID51_9GAMM|nr:PDR/VanB family oxidoreductase [Pseudomonas insulae]MBM7061039.1 oxidoreductase [Pseudomonas insulae]
MSTDLTVCVKSVRAEAVGVNSYELVAVDGGELPLFSPGAHIQLQLGNGMSRHYSLCNDAIERHRYKIAVGLSANSRGGSTYVHEQLRQGDRLTVSPPRNHFPLIEDGEHYEFIAGGIGITPILPMILWCEAKGKSWRLHYLAKSRAGAAFLDVLEQLPPRGQHLHFRDEHGGVRLDINAVVQAIPPAAHLYCCGPAGLMTQVRDTAAGRPSGLVHFEWFEAAVHEESASAGAFTVLARRSGLSLEVPADKSILETLEEAGLLPPYSCREGICNSCETRVLGGIPEHRDQVLSDAEKAANQTMLICVSRSKTPVLELDI